MEITRFEVNGNSVEVGIGLAPLHMDILILEAQ